MFTYKKMIQHSCIALLDQLLSNIIEETEISKKPTNKEEQYIEDCLYMAKKYIKSNNLGIESLHVNTKKANISNILFQNYNFSYIVYNDIYSFILKATSGEKNVNALILVFGILQGFQLEGKISYTDLDLQRCVSYLEKENISRSIQYEKIAGSINDYLEYMINITKNAIFKKHKYKYKYLESISKKYINVKLDKLQKGHIL